MTFDRKQNTFFPFVHVNRYPLCAFFFVGVWDSNHKPCIYYSLFLPTECAIEMDVKALMQQI